MCLSELWRTVVVFNLDLPLYQRDGYVRLWHETSIWIVYA
jgi:hypothetical protein